ncbi:FixH family protein [Peribacillus saganii]|nr:FixH family protein [Peribacillus saganii]
MKNNFIISLIIIFTIIIAGCTDEKDLANTGNKEEQHPPETGPEHHDENEEHDHHAHGDLLIEFDTQSSFNANEEAMLAAHILHDGLPLQEANVKFEIWQEGNESHKYIEADEESQGEYHAKTIFPEPGTYQVKIHLEKGDEIHDHEQNTIDIH